MFFASLWAAVVIVTAGKGSYMLGLEGCKFLIVGAGLWGSVLAERIASRLGERVIVIDRRPHAGGNCRSYCEPTTGIECHAYGTHVFHTSIPRVWEYIRAFSEFTPYRHKVLTEYRGRVYPMPISLASINSFYNLNLRPWEVDAFIRAEAGKEMKDAPANLEEKAISLVGRPLYAAFIKGYSQKQWGCDPRELPAAVITRLPVRANYNTEYFNDPWQGLPKDGYAALFARILAHPLIDAHLGVDYADIAEQVSDDCRVFYSGPIDAFFGFSLGALQWRSLRFEQEIAPHADYQGTAVLNQADIEVPFTRTHEYKHLHPERGEQGKRSVIEREYPKACAPGDEPYYPVNTPENEHLLAAYQAKLAERPNVTLGGRLGSYAYIDMDTTIASALALADTLCA